MFCLQEDPDAKNDPQHQAREQAGQPAGFFSTFTPSTYSQVSMSQYAPFALSAEPVVESAEDGLDPKPNANFALKLNTYDAVWYTLANGEHTRWIEAWIWAFILNGVAFFLQVGLTFMLLTFTIERREDHFETDLVSQAKLLSEATSTGKPLSNVTHAATLKLCKWDHNVPFSQSWVLWLWGVRVFPTVAQGIWRIIMLWRLPSAEGNQKTLVDDKVKLSIIRLSNTLKLVLLIAVDVPRIAVGIYLYIMGVKFLMYAPSLGVLVMKCVGLAFISQIPEFLVAALYSEKFVRDLGKAQVKFHRKQPNEDSMWNTWGAGCTTFTIIAILTLVITKIIYADVQNFRAACTAYEGKFVLPACGPNCGTHFLGMTFYN